MLRKQKLLSFNGNSKKASWTPTKTPKIPQKCPKIPKKSGRQKQKIFQSEIYQPICANPKNHMDNMDVIKSSPILLVLVSANVPH